MKTLYLDCKAGVSGDMFAASLIDLMDLPADFLASELKKLNLDGFQTKISKVDKMGVSATRFEVSTKLEKHHRHLSDIEKIIESSQLSYDVKELSYRIFRKLGKAEAKVHDTDISKIHFHEVGAIDSIVDIVSAAILFEKLKIDHVVCSPVSVGRGSITFTHGTTDLPVPAVRELLNGKPMDIKNIPKELTTPTGAAIIATLVDEFTEMPDGNIISKGAGAGTRNLTIPNVLESILLETDLNRDSLTVLETNIDDMNPELFEYVISQLIKKGAVEAYVQPCVMKKGRIGAILKVICADSEKENLIEAIFDETSTFGIRVNKCSRVVLKRHFEKVELEFGPINIKVGSYKGKVRSRSPEYEDCKRIAEENDIPLKDVYDAARVDRLPVFIR